MVSFIRSKHTKRFISGAIAALFVTLQAPLLLLASPSVSATATTTITNTNLAAYYESDVTGTCVKYDDVNSKTFTVPVDAAKDYTLAVVKAGSANGQGMATGFVENELIRTVTGGEVLVRSDGKDISHVILCYKAHVTTATVVFPVTLTFKDECGSENDTITIPVTTGVDYQVDLVTVPAGIYHVVSATSVTVTAVAQAGYTLGASTLITQTLTFPNDECNGEYQVVTPAVIASVDPCGTSGDTLAIPTTEGIDYKINGNIVTGTYHANGVLSVTVTAVAQQGYVLSDGAPVTQTITFTNKNCKPDTEKVSFCHKDGPSGKYSYIETATAATAHGHYDHKGDIIPAFTYNDVDYKAIGNQDLLITKCMIPVILANTVTPATIEVTDLCGTDNDTFTVPITPGVTYQLNGTPLSAGTHHAIGVVTVTAVANEGYTFTIGSEISQTLTFNSTACVDEHVGLGGGNGTPVTVLDMLTPPVIPAAAPVVSRPAANELVNTGSTMLLNIFAGLFILGTAGALAAVPSKRRYS